MEYQIVQGASVEQLEIMVNEEMKKSWWPIGGVCYGVKFCQSMVRYLPKS